MITKIFGTKARFCNANCASGFRADRQAGAIYGPYRINGVSCQDAEEYSLASLSCAYCGEHVNGKCPASLRDKFKIDNGEYRSLPLPAAPMPSMKKRKITINQNDDDKITLQAFVAPQWKGLAINRSYAVDTWNVTIVSCGKTLLAVGSLTAAVNACRKLRQLSPKVDWTGDEQSVIACCRDHGHVATIRKIERAA